MASKTSRSTADEDDVVPVPDSPLLTLRVTGREAETRLPALLVPALRSGTQAADSFLPAGYLRATRTFDVAPAAARGLGDAAARHTHAAHGDEIVVLELADGSTLVTSAERLRASLPESHPELLGADGTLLLDRLRADAAAPHRGFGEAAGGLILKVYTLIAGEAADAIVGDALGRLENAAELGVSWAGTKALMWAVEKRLDLQPGLYRWRGASGLAGDFEPAQLMPSPAFPPGPPLTPTPTPTPKTAPARSARAPSADAARADTSREAMLIFIHGTGSSTLGSFGDLRTSDRDLWGALEARYRGGIYAFEHRTLSASPIDNAIALAEALPAGARVSLVSHSRGGLVGDLLCLGDFDALIDSYAYAFEGTGDADPAENQRVLGELRGAHAGQREQLRTLAGLLRERRIVVERYVRAASPANGTKLASGNFDVFLSGVLSLIGAVPLFFGSPVYAAFKRIVIEIAKHRTNAHLVPGIEAMLPDSPMARLLRDAPVRPGVAMAVIAGDIQGGHLLKRLGVMLSDFLLFDSDDNDLVVNTSAMLAGIAPKAGARVLFDRGADVSHFRYFSNQDTRTALRDWLIADDPGKLDTFRALPRPDEFDAALAAAAVSRAIAPASRPIVVVLPGVMGSHLAVNNVDRVWFDPLDIVGGGLTKIAWGEDAVEAEEIFAMFYGRICGHLADSHRVEPFPYDWRQPLDVLAERLGEFLDRLLHETEAPIRLLAHSMGGLVVRACIHKRRSVMDALMARDGARLVMLGTPNQGAHSMVENLLGKGDTLRTLVRLDLTHTMQDVLDLVGGFRGALQLLPKPGFVDTFQGQEGGGGHYAFQQAATWVDLKAKVTDLWFGDQRAATPPQDVLDAGAWLWSADGAGRPSLPAAYEAASVYVFGVAGNTPCGVREEPRGGGKGDAGEVRLKLVGTTRGDGTVTWDSGRIGGIGSYYWMAAQHGDLPSTAEHFPALADLLTAGATTRLPTSPPAVRAVQQPEPVVYDAGPPIVEDADALQRGLMGGSLRNRVPPRPKRRLEVTIQAMDLRFLNQPLMVGHYEQDPIAGPEALIDRELLDGDLSERHSLGLYAGARGTASVVLRVPNEIERGRGSFTGAVVTGLGRYDGALSPSDLTEAVRTGALRYLLQVIDVLGEADREVPLASLLLGFNSSANLTVAASVEALVRGVMEANAKFYDTTRLNIRIGRLDIVELYLDTAITAVYALRHLGERLAAQAGKLGATLVSRPHLQRGEGVRQRLFDDRNASYWPRLIITDAERDETQMTPGAAGSDSGGAAPLADRLRFLYVGARARAESVIQQRQPGLIEQLVAQQIHDAVWNENFGRMLFQLMVPHDFKDAARELDRVVLVVDRATANLPWELMLADDPSRADNDNRPLALRAAVVRQLSSTRFRSHVRQAIDRRALVIGNPSVAGFAAAFPPPGGASQGIPSPGGGHQRVLMPGGGAHGVSAPPAAVRPEPPDLPGAEAEAEEVAALLANMGYEVAAVIGGEQAATNVLTRLFQQPWRLLHISAHGVYDLPHADGRRRSGVLLSGGLLLTAAEIAAMEVVPDLVFLNCCHLGRIDGDGRRGHDHDRAAFGGQGNKLAASVARELIDVGVRCVIVAGWAVNDESARLFGQTFYEQLLLRRLPFGDAVFEARRVTWEAHRDDITWGAFQAYGDPGWLAEPRGRPAPSTGAAGLYVSPDELLDELARTRADLSRRRGLMSPRETQGRAELIAALMRERVPLGWTQLPQLQSALGVTWFELGELERAHQAFLAAVQVEDTLGVVPIRDIERLASVEARLGEQRAEAEMDAQIDARRAGIAEPPAGQGEALIDLALRRLDGLDALVSARLADDAAAALAAPDAAAALATSVSDPHSAPNIGRSALRGNAWKRKASLRARALLRGELDPTEQDRASRQMTDFLHSAIAAYGHAEGSPGSSHFSPYLALNRLALDALTDWPDDAARDAAIALAQQCRQTAARNFAASPGSWDAAVQPDALLVERLLDGSLGREGDAGRAAFEEIALAYADATKNVTFKPSQIDSMVMQMVLLSRYCDALAVGRHDDAALKRTADQLIALAERMQPGRKARTDRLARRPMVADDAPAAPAAPATSRAEPVAKPEAKPAARKSRRKRTS